MPTRRNDITNDVVYNLNRIYKATGGPSVKGSATTTPSATSGPAAGPAQPEGGNVSRIEPSRQCGARRTPVRPGRARSRSACRPGQDAAWQLTRCQARGAGGVERNSPDLSTHAARQRPLDATRSVRMRKRQIHAYHQAFATHACFRHGSARGRVLSWLGRHPAVQPRRTRHRRGFRSFRPPGSAHRARPDRPCRSVASDGRRSSAGRPRSR